MNSEPNGIANETSAHNRSEITGNIAEPVENMEEDEFGEFNQADSQIGSANDFGFNGSIEKGISNLTLRML